MNWLKIILILPFMFCVGCANPAIRWVQQEYSPMGHYTLPHERSKPQVAYSEPYGEGIGFLESEQMHLDPYHDPEYYYDAQFDWLKISFSF